MLQRWFARARAFWAKPWVETGALLLYYLAILVGLSVIYGHGAFVTPHFIYQGF
jgi:hypothetical protein